MHSHVSSWKNRFRHLPFILRLLALSCLILALARPQKRNDEQQTEGEGIDIVLCMDVSGSMGSTGYSAIPNGSGQRSGSRNLSAAAG